MKTFLSVDLDYWNEVDNRYSRMTKYLKSIYHAPVPVVLVRDHDEMLPFVDSSGARFLINLDYHSDLADIFVEDDEIPVLGKTRDFNCGTWINWVQRRARGRFLWIHPQKDCYNQTGWNCKGAGRCDADLNPFTSEFDTGWKEAKHKTGPPPKINGIQDLVMVGLCVSPDWINFGEDMAFDILEESGFDRSDRCVDGPVIYCKGRRRSYVKEER